MSSFWNENNDHVQDMHHRSRVSAEQLQSFWSAGSAGKTLSALGWHGYLVAAEASQE